MKSVRCRDSRQNLKTLVSHCKTYICDGPLPCLGTEFVALLVLNMPLGPLPRSTLRACFDLLAIVGHAISSQKCAPTAHVWSCGDLLGLISAWMCPVASISAECVLRWVQDCSFNAQDYPLGWPGKGEIAIVVVIPIAIVIVIVIFVVVITAIVVDIIVVNIITYDL